MMTLLVFLSSLVLVVAGNCPSVLKLGPPIEGYALNGPAMITVKAPTEDYCQLYCLGEDYCASYNWGPPLTNGDHLCEIHDRRQPSSYRLEKKNGHLLRAGKCKINPCHNGGVCAALFDENNTTCFCRPRFIGITCDKNDPGQFEILQNIPTTGATAVTTFKINNKQFIVFANLKYNKGSSHLDGFSFKTVSPTYQLDGEEFTLNQSIATIGPFDVKHFVIDGYHFLAMSNFYDRTGFVDPVVYRFEDGQFNEFQRFTIQKCLSLCFYQISTRKFLAAVSSSGSVLFYEWKTGKFVQVQKYVPASTKQMFGCTAFNIDNQTFFVFTQDNSANASTVLEWNGSQMEDFQTLGSSHVLQPCYVNHRNTHYLALAVRMAPVGFNSVTDSFVYRWKDGKFVFYQTIPTNNGHDCTFFANDGDMFLAMANRDDKSTIFKLNGDRFEEYQRIHTTSARSIHSFVHNGQLYLAAASYGVGIQFNRTSPVFKWSYQTYP